MTASPSRPESLAGHRPPVSNASGQESTVNELYPRGNHMYTSQHQGEELLPPTLIRLPDLTAQPAIRTTQPAGELPPVEQAPAETGRIAAEVVPPPAEARPDVPQHATMRSEAALAESFETPAATVQQVIAAVNEDAPPSLAKSDPIATVNDNCFAAPDSACEPQQVIANPSESLNAHGAEPVPPPYRPIPALPNVAPAGRSRMERIGSQSLVLVVLLVVTLAAFFAGRRSEKAVPGEAIEQVVPREERAQIAATADVKPVTDRQSTFAPEPNTPPAIDQSMTATEPASIPADTPEQGDMEFPHTGAAEITSNKTNAGQSQPADSLDPPAYEWDHGASNFAPSDLADEAPFDFSAPNVSNVAPTGYRQPQPMNPLTADAGVADLPTQVYPDGVRRNTTQATKIQLNRTIEADTAPQPLRHSSTPSHIDWARYLPKQATAPADEGSIGSAPNISATSPPTPPLR